LRKVLATGFPLSIPGAFQFACYSLASALGSARGHARSPLASFLNHGRDVASMTSLAFLSIARLSEMLDAAALDAEALTRQFLDRAEGVGRALNCYITLCRETALAEARAAKERMAAKRRRGKLDGIPVALKDNIDVAGVPTSNGFGGAPYRVPAED